VLGVTIAREDVRARVEPVALLERGREDGRDVPRTRADVRHARARPVEIREELDHAQEVERELGLVLQACRKHSIELPPLEEYWLDLWSSLGRPLENDLAPAAKRPLQELRKLGERAVTHLPELSGSSGKVWRNGFQQLFGAASLGNSWEERMASATLRAVAASAEVVILTRRVPGRNVQVHTSGGCALEENTRWVVHVQPKGIGHRQVLCVHHPVT
jgi:hypothetical protein